MSACGLAVGVGLDELLDPPSPEHPTSSNEKEQVETNLRTTDELSDMETPGRWPSAAQTRPKLQAVIPLVPSRLPKLLDLTAKKPHMGLP
jgi:hypothetical protein